MEISEFILECTVFRTFRQKKDSSSWEGQAIDIKVTEWGNQGIKNEFDVFGQYNLVYRYFLSPSLLHDDVGPVDTKTEKKKSTRHELNVA